MTTILIVDDNAANTALLQDILARQGYDVIAARHGADALEIAQHTPPDMIITDILMPVMDGFALCRAWQQDERLRTIPFVFHTATYTTTEDQAFGLSLGAARYLIKPTKPSELVTILREVLEESETREPAAVGHLIEEETTYLKEYNEALIRKLERKVAQLETANRALEREIDERQRLERAVRDFRNRYEIMFQKHVAIMLLIDPETGDIIDANQAAFQYYGYSHDELVSMNISDINTLSKQQIYEEMRQARAEKRTHFIFRHALRSGEIRDVEVFTAPIEIEGKTLLYSIIHDITDRMQVEDALRASEDQHRRIFESVTDGLLITDLDATVVEVNPAACRMYGYERDELIGLRATDLIHPDYHPVLEQFIDNVKDTGMFAGETIDIRKSGEMFNTEVKGTTMVFQGKPHLLAIIRDVTARKQAEQRRVEFEVEKERATVLQHFIGHASHDLRTPLTTIKTNIYLLRKLSDPEKQERHMTILETQTAHLERLLEDMLNMSRLDQAIDFKFAPLDVNTVVQGVVIRQRLLAESKNHTLTFSADPALLPALADKIQLDYALTNIVLNALHYTPDGGAITIRMCQRNDHAIIEVQDTGIGIGPDDLPRIFDRFYRVDKARGADTGGVGLGLAIAKRIIEAHQGQIEVESELGHGSIFRVLLPSP